MSSCVTSQVLAMFCKPCEENLEDRETMYLVHKGERSLGGALKWGRAGSLYTGG